MTLRYSITSSETTRNVAVVVDGIPLVTDGTNPNYDRIVAGLIKVPQDESVVSLFNLETAVAEQFEHLSERVMVANGQVYFDGDAVHSVLTDHIIDHLNEGVEFGGLVNLFENLEQNKSPHSRENFYRWAHVNGLTTDQFGYVIAYKGVRKAGDDYFSINTSGSAIVDGEVKRGAIPNALGSIVEMPRSEVQFDPAVGCSTGLHCGSWDYAKGFSQGAVLTVRVHPRDIVSVPTECNDAKMRVCRYEVLDVTDTKIESSFFGYFVQDDEGFEDPDDYDWDDDYDEDCECPDCVEYAQDNGFNHVTGDYSGTADLTDADRIADDLVQKDQTSLDDLPHVQPGDKFDAVTGQKVQDDGPTDPYSIWPY